MKKSEWKADLSISSQQQELSQLELLTGYKGGELSHSKGKPWGRGISKYTVIRDIVKVGSKDQIEKVLRKFFSNKKFRHFLELRAKSVKQSDVEVIVEVICYSTTPDTSFQFEPKLLRDLAELGVRLSTRVYQIGDSE
jgi:hypothetical protein